MEKYPAIIIGAGIGGLTAAAYLAKEGISPLVIEQTPFPGGRCYSRIINDTEFDIGAIYIGERAPQILKHMFDIDCAYKPYRMGIKIGNDFVSVPFDRQTLRDLRKCNTPRLDILRFLMKVPALFRSSYFDRFISVGDVLDYTINNDTIRQIGYVLFGVSGVSPHRLSSHYLRLDKNANGTRVGNPVHLFGGNKRVADTLTTFILAHGGRLVFNEKVERIIFEGNRASGVVTNNNNYSMDFLISNTDIRTTVLRLSQPWHWEDSYLKEIQALNQPLALVCIFLTFDSSFELPEGFGVFFMSGDNPSEEFQALEAGCFPTQSTFSLQIPTNFEDPTPKYHRATLQFYYPKGAVSPQVLQQQIDMIMNDGLEQLFPGLTGRVVSYTVYDPTRYEQEFGLKPIVFGVSPDLNYRRLPQQTPVHNLFCVGDSVQPEKPSVPQAMESGLECARIIAARFGSTQSFD